MKTDTKATETDRPADKRFKFHVAVGPVVRVFAFEAGRRSSNLTGVQLFEERVLNANPSLLEMTLSIE